MIKPFSNIEFLLSNNVTEILGDARVTAAKLEKPFNGSLELKLDGIFIEVGTTPATALPEQMGCALDEKKYLKVGADMSTNIPGVFGAGDVTSGSNYFAQFATAAGEGSIAANSVFSYLQGGK